MKKFNKGFTLIELLIVIALLGALAVALLAALDPFEQLKKGTDTGVRNTVAEIQGAIIRYYGVKTQMPWCQNSTCVTPWRDATITGQDLPATGLLASQIPNTIIEISDAGELKDGFSALAGPTNMGKIRLFGGNLSLKVEVCYKPTAKSFINDPNTKFVANTGVEKAATPLCRGQGGTDETCLWCIQ